MPRVLPIECEHGRTVDWGDFGPDDDSPPPGCPECDALPPMFIPGPIPVTVDDEHAQPVTGYLLRLPEEMGGEWVVKGFSYGTSVYDLGTLARTGRAWQKVAALDTNAAPGSYTEARWWAEAYRVALKAER